MSTLLLAPYLPLSKPMAIREWRLIPFKLVREAEIVPGALAKPTERLIAAYGRDDGMGAVVVSSERAINSLRKLDIEGADERGR